MTWRHKVKPAMSYQGHVVVGQYCIFLSILITPALLPTTGKALWSPRATLLTGFLPSSYCTKTVQIHGGVYFTGASCSSSALESSLLKCVHELYLGPSGDPAIHGLCEELAFSVTFVPALIAAGLLRSLCKTTGTEQLGAKSVGAIFLSLVSPMHPPAINLFSPGLDGPMTRMILHWRLCFRILNVAFNFQQP